MPYTTSNATTRLSTLSTRSFVSIPTRQRLTSVKAISSMTSSATTRPSLPMIRPFVSIPTSLLLTTIKALPLLNSKNQKRHELTTKKLVNLDIADKHNTAPNNNKEENKHINKICLSPSIGLRSKERRQASFQPLRDLGREVCNDHIRACTPDTRQHFHDDTLLVNPAVLGSGFDHGVLAAHVLGG